eukprot:1202834-Pyramimonas_sp.AAC.1
MRERDPGRSEAYRAAPAGVTLAHEPGAGADALSRTQTSQGTPASSQGTPASSPASSQGADSVLTGPLSASLRVWPAPRSSPAPLPSSRRSTSTSPSSSSSSAACSASSTPSPSRSPVSSDEALAKPNFPNFVCNFPAIFPIFPKSFAHPPGVVARAPLLGAADEPSPGECLVRPGR